jgi:peptidoglycan/LPS O-acetylase OafA/YrhL
MIADLSPRHTAMNANRIAPLDAIRGLAALGVALLHYALLTPDGARPFQAALWWVYGYGQLAVPLFYLLSGYIFFEAYARPLGEGRLTGRDFFWLRASRLYPLHLLTLLTVAALQALAWRAAGHYFAYVHNDWRHFLLNLGFLQFGWFDPVMSFNGPTWSLTIEAGLYVTFFAFARRFGAAARPRLAFGALCLALSSARMLLPLSGPINVFFAEGLGCFFVGGCLQLTERWPERPRLLGGLALLALGAGLFHATGGRRETAPVLFAGATMLALALPAFRRAADWRLFGWLGEISYSTYLWHFPVQIALVVVSATIMPLSFSSPAMLALYLALTLSISTLSFRWFEAPARALVRRLAFARPLATARA